MNFSKLCFQLLIMGVTYAGSFPNPLHLRDELGRKSGKFEKYLRQ